MAWKHKQVSSFAANNALVCQIAQNLLIPSAISINTDEKQMSDKTSYLTHRFRRMNMTLLIVALAMTATMGFLALHLAESENAKNKRLQRRSDHIAGFASL